MKNIAQVRKSIGEDATRAAVAVMVDDLQKSIQLTQPMTPFQIDVAAEVICKEYYFLKLEEIRICFMNAISGKYGKIYNRVDAAVICEWLNAYMTKRTTISERLNQIDVQQNNIYDVFQNDTMRGVLQDVVDKMKLKEVETDKRPEPERKMSPFEEMVLDEWEKLPMDERFGLRVYDNSLYDFTDYRKKRFEELHTNENG